MKVCCYADRAIRHRACALRDTAEALLKAELDPDFEKICQEITQSRKRRGLNISSVLIFTLYFTDIKYNISLTVVCFLKSINIFLIAIYKRSKFSCGFHLFIFMSTNIVMFKDTNIIFQV